MATNTTNYNLVKPSEEEFYDVRVNNNNMDILDGLLFDLNKNKVAKIEGKPSENDFTNELKEKLDGISEGAGNYTHPLKHPPSIIEQDLNNRFISDLELAQIENNKKDLSSHLDINARHTTQGEKDTWNSKSAGNHNHNGVYEPALPTERKRKITLGTANPSGGSNGDIYFQYE